jgi:pimeloyl-ACP methyl ester carboxylesterase
MPATIANGIRQNHEVLLPRGTAPDPPTIVCVHGILIDSLASYYFTVAQALRDAGFRVVLYDLRGHGKTEQPPSGYRVDDFVADLAGLLDALGVGAAYFLGNSFGGTVVYGFAARHPHRVAGITVIESEPATTAWSTKMAANLHKAATQLGTWEATAWITARYGRDLARRAKRAARLLGATTLERDLPTSTVLSEPGIAAIECPTLALYGSKSDLAAQAEHLRALMPGYEAVILPGLEHSVLVEATARVLDLLLGWLREHQLARRGPS